MRTGGSLISRSEVPASGSARLERSMSIDGAKAPLLWSISAAYAPLLRQLGDLHGSRREHVVARERAVWQHPD